MGLPVLVLVLAFLCFADTYHHHRRHTKSDEAYIQLIPWRRAPRQTKSEISFSFSKRGTLGRVSFDVDVLLPPTQDDRDISYVKVDFDPSSSLNADVTVTRGGIGFDYATVRFTTNEDMGDMTAFISLDTKPRDN